MASPIKVSSGVHAALRRMTHKYDESEILMALAKRMSDIESELSEEADKLRVLGDPGASEFASRSRQYRDVADSLLQLTHRVARI